jgi:glycosyltransferase involved in cell wall biosynthesis
VTAIHQFVPTLTRGDAIGHHVLELRDVLRGMGVRSEIFAAEIHPDVASDARPYREYTGRDGPAGLLYHGSTASPIVTFLADRPEPKLVDYHNVTPAAFFTGWDPVQAMRLRAARGEIAALVRAAPLVIAHSRFSARDVAAWGHRDPTVAPVLGGSFLDPDPAGPDAAPAGGDDRPEGPSWLFVGRRAPNKAQHRLVDALVIFRRIYGIGAHLHLVGADAPRAYGDALTRLAAAAGVADAVHVHDALSAAELAALYRRADVFVSASVHEGYCVPVLEAMHFGVPVVARAAAAVPETAGGAAVLVPGDSASMLAVAVHRVLSDPALRDELVAAGRARVAALAGGHDVYRRAFGAFLGRAA